jgi:SAM-dependent methyltransferase
VSARTPALLDDRASREAAAYDEDGVWQRSQGWYYRVRHVVEGPNTLAAERAFQPLLAERARGGRVLDVGCAGGDSTRRVSEYGAEYALGIDVAETMLAEARRHEVPGEVEFRVQSAGEPMPGRFDLIFGRSVLHHIDFREFLSRAYEENLSPGGRMVFMEPCGHPLTVAFHLLAKRAHTPDEFTLLPRDIKWMRGRFPGLRVLPVNFLSFPAGIVSTPLFATADNALMRAADRADALLARRRRLAGYGRQGILVIDKP